MKIKQAVQDAAAETDALHAAVGDISGFVKTVDQIAEQTNLLGLNAAIEAARAGAEGAGFAVVAGEVRKLAAEARTSAESVAAITRTVTQRVDSAARTMTAGAAHVGEIEVVARQVEAALATILRRRRAHACRGRERDLGRGGERRRGGGGGGRDRAGGGDGGGARRGRRGGARRDHAAGGRLRRWWPTPRGG